MSRENLERLRSAGERGTEDPEAFFGIFDPDVEWVTLLFDARETRGVDAVRRFFRDWLAPFAHATFEWEELIEAGDEVVSIGRWRATGKASRAEAEVQLIQVWTFRDGKVVRCRDFATRAEALEAAGLTA